MSAFQLHTQKLFWVEGEGWGKKYIKKKSKAVWLSCFSYCKQHAPSVSTTESTHCANMKRIMRVTNTRRRCTKSHMTLVSAASAVCPLALSTLTANEWRTKHTISPNICGEKEEKSFFFLFCLQPQLHVSLSKRLCPFLCTARGRCFLSPSPSGSRHTFLQAGFCTGDCVQRKILLYANRNPWQLHVRSQPVNSLTCTKNNTHYLFCVWKRCSYNSLNTNACTAATARF